MEAEANIKWVADLLENIMRMRDPYENHHGRAVSELARRYADEVGMSIRDTAKLDLGARVHDIGKLLIPESIINKPAKLTPQEWEIIKKHPEYGIEMLSIIKVDTIVTDIILQHHENLDGSGYPRGLKAGEISPFAKIIRVIDTFESITRRRAYKPADAEEKALEEIAKGVGRKYDPFVSETFQKIILRNGYNQIEE